MIKKSRDAVSLNKMWGWGVFLKDVMTGIKIFYFFICVENFINMFFVSLRLGAPS
jgi:hypothetical protein